MHIAFHLAIDRIFGAVFTSTVLPALALVTELPGGNDVFPLYAAGAVFIFAHLIAARLQINNAFFALPVNFTSAIKRTGRISVDFYRRGFRLRKTIDTFGQRRAGKCCAQYHRSNRQITVHHLLRVKTSQQRSESCFGMQSARSGKFLIFQVVISQPAVHRSEHSDRRPRHELRDYGGVR